MIELFLILLGACAILALPFVILRGLLEGFSAAAKARPRSPAEDRSILEFLSLLVRRTFWAIVIALMLWVSWRVWRM